MTFERTTVALLFCASILGAGPSTRPAIPPMTLWTDRTVGVAFDRPARWTTFAPVEGGDPSVAFGEPEPWAARVQAHLRVSMRDTPRMTVNIDTTSPSDPAATASKAFTVDGVPARLTAFPTPDHTAEVATVQTAKGSRSYTLTVVYPASRRADSLAMVDAVCESIRLPPPR